MYRLLAEHAEVRERRDQLRHPVYAAPELLARRPNELWSWDITKLLGPAKWTYFSLYVMLDVFSRYVVGWMVSQGENATLAEQFIRATCARQGIGRDQLTIHADRGQAMVAKSVAFLLADLGVTKTHSRPHVSNDNPFSEAQFKTLKYRPAFPDRFGSLQAARARGGRAHSLNSMTDCLIPIDRFRSSAIRASTKSMPAVTPPPDRMLPSLTMRPSSTMAPKTGSNSRHAQWQAARRPRRKPAAPKMSDPVHTEVR